MSDFRTYADGFEDPRFAEQCLTRISASVPADGLTFLDRFLHEALRAPDPQDILTKFDRLAASMISKGSFYRMLSEYSPLVARLAHLFSTSQYLSEMLIKDPELVSFLLSPEVSCPPVLPERLRTDFHRITSASTDSPGRKLDRLRVAKRREILKIGIRDYILEEPFDRITWDISTLACVCLQSVMTIQEEILSAKYGIASTPLAVIAVGKLGGFELNYSSDIDLMFVYRDEGPIGRTTCHEFFNELASMILSALSARTREGILYRADARLRPDGTAGPLARSEASTMHYYEARGQVWERQMLIKARAVAGDLEYGERFLSKLAPFIYPRSSMSSPVEDIARMKWRIEERQRGDALNIKSCQGGIRDIEFLTQALQLLHGGRQVELRCPATLEALRRLFEAGHFSVQEYDLLRDAYVFYRQIEHLLQIDHDLQTHTLPDTPKVWKRLAALSGFPSPEDFRNALERYRFRVRQLYDSFFELSGSVQSEPIDMILAEHLSDHGFEHLSRAGFQNPHTIHRTIRTMCYGDFPNPLSRTVDHAFRPLLQVLLTDAKDWPDPDHVLTNFARLVSSHPFKEALYKSLGEKIEFRKTILHLCALSPFITNILCDQPVFIDQIEINLQDWIRNSTHSVRPVPKNPEGLHAFKAFEHLRVVASDFHSCWPQESLHEQLTAIADTVLSMRFRRFFEPIHPLVVIGLGKLGGRELSFKSDLDVVFVCGDDADMDDLIARAKEFLNDISQITPKGKLYDIDARLRPEGKQAPLVVTLARYRDYLASRAMLWERQAIVKARVVCGDEQLAFRVTSFFTNLCQQSGLTASEAKHIVRMRERQKSEKASSSDDSIREFKYSSGGLTDLEYAIQALQMRHGIHGQGTVQAMHRLLEARRITEDEKSRLCDGYRFLRELEKWNYLLLERRTNKLPSDEKQLAFLARFCKLRSTDRLMAALSEVKKQNQLFFSQTMGKLCDG